MRCHELAADLPNDCCDGGFLIERGKDHGYRSVRCLFDFDQVSFQPVKGEARALTQKLRSLHIHLRNPLGTFSVLRAIVATTSRRCTGG